MTDTAPDLLAIGQVNLQILIDEAGSEEAFCQTTGLSTAYVYNWLRKQPKQQIITLKSAAIIEDKFNRKRGWMHNHLLIDQDGNEVNPKPKRKTKSKPKLPPLSDLSVHRSRHNALDQMVADFIEETGQRPSTTNLMEFMKWSYSKTLP